MQGRIASFGEGAQMPMVPRLKMAFVYRVDVNVPIKKPMKIAQIGNREQNVFTGNGSKRVQNLFGVIDMFEDVKTGNHVKRFCAELGQRIIDIERTGGAKL